MLHNQTNKRNMIIVHTLEAGRREKEKKGRTLSLNLQYMDMTT